jgi:uncharacterized protein
MTPTPTLDHTTLSEKPAVPDPSDLDVVLRFYAALMGPNPPDARHRMTGDVTVHVPGTHPLSGDHIGPDAVLAFVERSRALTDDGLRSELLDVLNGRGHIGLYFRVRATRGSRSLDNHTIHRARVQAGRVAEVWFHNHDDLAVDDFWR